MSRPGYTEDEAGHVVLTMTHNDFHNLLLAIGFFGGALDPINLREHLAMINRLTEGSPLFTPYDLTPPQAH